MITPDVLRAIPLFEPLEDTQLQAIAIAMGDIHLQKDEWLVHEGELPSFFILLSGNLEVTKVVGGVEQILDLYHPGDYFGEVPLLMGSTVLANLRAVNPVRVARMDSTDFHNILLGSDKLAVQILKTMSRRIGNLQRASVETPVARTLIVGHTSDMDCHDLRQFFAGNHLPYLWLDPENTSTIAMIPEPVRVEPYPAVVLPDGTVLREPNRRILAERLGIQTVPQQTHYDVVIIGGGPAGLAAAVYGASEGLRTLMVEREAPGGQAGTSSRIENYLGFPTGLSGDELGTRALQQAKRFGTEIVVTRSVRAIQSECELPEVVLDGDTSVCAKTIVLATGVSWRRLDVPGAEKLIGRGIYYGAARTEALNVRGKDVYLIGGGNSAGQAALFFADYASTVTLLIRASAITKGMSQYLIDQIATKENIAVSLNSSVVAVQGESALAAITVRNEVDNTETRFETDSLFVFIGADAETSWLPQTVARDERGYILTGREAKESGNWTLSRDPYLLETSVPGLFAAGDVRHGSIKRVASGVGEGSMAIAFIHQYLALNEKSTLNANPAASTG